MRKKIKSGPTQIVLIVGHCAFPHHVLVDEVPAVARAALRRPQPGQEQHLPRTRHNHIRRLGGRERGLR